MSRKLLIEIWDSDEDIQLQPGDLLRVVGESTESENWMWVVELERPVPPTLGISVGEGLRAQDRLG